MPRRFDAVVFLDLPGRDEKEAIWRLYLDKYQLDADQRLPKDDNWTGAEVKACCRLAALLDVPLVQARTECRPGGRHGCGVGRQTPHLGQRSVSVRQPTGHLQPQRRQRKVPLPAPSPPR